MFQIPRELYYCPSISKMRTKSSCIYQSTLNPCPQGISSSVKRRIQSAMRVGFRVYFQSRVYSKKGSSFIGSRHDNYVKKYNYL